MTYSAWIDYGREQGWLPTDERLKDLSKHIGQQVKTTHGEGVLQQVWAHRVGVGIGGKLVQLPHDAVIV
jgi:hypothetical protein